MVGTLVEKSDGLAVECSAQSDGFRGLHGHENRIPLWRFWISENDGSERNGQVRGRKTIEGDARSGLARNQQALADEQAVDVGDSIQ